MLIDGIGVLLRNGEATVVVRCTTDVLPRVKGIAVKEVGSSAASAVAAAVAIVSAMQADFHVEAK